MHLHGVHLYSFLGVPLIGFIIWLVRRMMRVKSKDSYLGWMFGGLMDLGLGLCYRCLQRVW